VPALGKPNIGQRVLYPPRYNIRYPVAATGSPTPSKPVIHHSVEELLMMENNISSPELATPSLTSSVQTPELRRTRRLTSHSLSYSRDRMSESGPRNLQDTGTRSYPSVRSWRQSSDVKKRCFSLVATRPGGYVPLGGKHHVALARLGE